MVHHKTHHKTPMIKLNNGRQMHAVGFGCWKVDNAVCADTIYNAIKAGYRLFDGAADYGNEKECGEGVARAIREGIVTREELFITSKLWHTYHEKHRVQEIVLRQLADWQIDYFDLYLIHFPVALEYVDPEERYPPGWFYDGVSEVRWSKATNQETWEAMEDLVEKGLALSIGISNFQAQVIYDLLKYAKIRPAVLQMELHPYLQQNALVRLCKAEGIAITAYSSFGPASFIDLGVEIAKNIAALLDHHIIKKIAENHHKTTAQVLLCWAYQRGCAVIPKTSRPSVMAENLESVHFVLEEDEMNSIATLDMNIKFNKPANYFNNEHLLIFD